jgi:hypothetical protein
MNEYSIYRINTPPHWMDNTAPPCGRMPPRNSISKKLQKRRDFRKTAPDRTAVFRQEPRNLPTGEAAVATLMQAPGIPDRLRHNPDLHAIISGYVPPELPLLGGPTLEALKLLVKQQRIGQARLLKQVTPEIVDRSVKYLLNFLIHGKDDDILFAPLRHLGQYVCPPPGSPAYDRARLSPHGRLIWDAVKIILQELKQSAQDDDSEDYD